MGPERGRQQRRGGGFSDLVDGIRYRMTDPTMRVLLVVSTLFAMLSMPNQFLLPGFVSGVLDQGPDKLGLLMSVGGIGSLIGSLLIASLPSIGPEIPSLEIAAIQELATVDQWVLWKLEGEPNSEGKRNKTPKHPRGFNADVSNPETWSS